MSILDKLNYAKSRLGLAKLMGDADEVTKWQEHVNYWLAELAK